jgi:hypothetical protein
MMSVDKRWAVKGTDQSDSTIQLRDSSLRFDSSDAGRPIPISRLRATVARASITADTPYGTVCTLSEQGMGKAVRVLSDFELPLAIYNAPGTTDLGYDLYMPPEQFEDFIATLIPKPGAGGATGGATIQPLTEFHAVKHRGMFFAIWLIARMFGGIMFLGAGVFLLAEAFPEYEDDMVMALVLLIPLASFGMIRTIIKAKGPNYRIQLSAKEITILCPGKPTVVSINLANAVALRVNWVATGRYGRRPTGPALEFLHGDQRKTRIALSDPQDMWPEKIPEISEPHFVISRQAWVALRAIVP